MSNVVGFENTKLRRNFMGQTDTVFMDFCLEEDWFFTSIYKWKYMRNRHKDWDYQTIFQSSRIERGLILLKRIQTVNFGKSLENIDVLDIFSISNKCQQGDP